MDELTIKEVHTRSTSVTYIYRKIHKNEVNYLPPIYMDEWKFFDKKQILQICRCTALLLTGTINRSAGLWGLLTEGITLLTMNIMEGFVSWSVMMIWRPSALISRIENWARQNGMNKIVGPLGFSDKDPQGFQIEGFEYPPFITSPGNSPYMVSLIEKEGYIKKVDLVNYIGAVPEIMPPVYEKVLERLNKTQEYRIWEFTTRKELKAVIIPVLQLMNDTFSDIYGFVPLNDREKSDLAATYLPIIDPRFVKVVEKDGRLIGFAVGIPDMSPGIKACNGRLFPFGFLKVIRESRRSKTPDAAWRSH